MYVCSNRASDAVHKRGAMECIRGATAYCNMGYACLNILFTSFISDYIKHSDKKLKSSYRYHRIQFGRFLGARIWRRPTATVWARKGIRGPSHQLKTLFFNFICNFIFLSDIFNVLYEFLNFL